MDRWMKWKTYCVMSLFLSLSFCASVPLYYWMKTKREIAKTNKLKKKGRKYKNPKKLMCCEEKSWVTHVGFVLFGGLICIKNYPLIPILHVLVFVSLYLSMVCVCVSVCHWSGQDDAECMCLMDVICFGNEGEGE